MMTNSNTTPKANPALLFSGILKQLGALSLLAGLYKLAFPSKKPSNRFNMAPKGNTASSCFLNCFKLFVGASILNSTYNAFNNASAPTNPTNPANPSKPKGP